jgi:predicted nucleic acid-binding protein
MIIPDANLIIYAHNQADPDHAAALAWWKAFLAGDVDVGIPIVVVLAFLRLTNSPSGERTNIMDNVYRTLIVMISLLAAVAGAAEPSAEAPPRAASAAAECQRRVELVTGIPGLAAFWDFVTRENGPGGNGHFLARKAVAGERRYPLVPWNISRTYWNEGEEATMDDFPLLGRGPFGQAVQFRDPRRIDDLPVLMVPRKLMHDTPLDVKGPGKSVSMVVWMVYQGGNHAIGGIWHEGTDTKPNGPPAVVRVRGQRQYGLFAGLGARG